MLHLDAWLPSLHYQEKLISFQTNYPACGIFLKQHKMNQDTVINRRIFM